MALHNLEHLRTFLTVLRAGSLSEAARLLGISQPTVSSHVQLLERQLGFPLFERTPAGVTATPRAVELATEVAAHIDALDDLAFTMTATDDAGSIHLGGPAEFLTTVVLPRLAQLTEVTGTRIHVRFGLADELLNELRSGALDIVVSAVQPHVRGVSGRPLFDEEFALVAAPSWLPRRPGETELRSIPVVAYAENLPIIRRYWRTVFGRRPELVVRSVIPDLRGIRSAIVGGAGMSVLPDYLIEDELASGALVLLHRPEVPPLNTVYSATRSGDYDRRPSLRAAIDVIRHLAVEASTRQAP